MSKLKILHNYVRVRRTNFFIIYWNVSETQTNANYFCVFFCICSFIDISLNGMLIDKEVYYIFYYLTPYRIYAINILSICIVIIIKKGEQHICDSIISE